MNIHLVHALPNSFLPNPGQLLRTEGLTIEQAADLLRHKTVVSHIRYDDLSQIISQELGTAVEASTSNCPSPFTGVEVLLCTRSPGETQVKYTRLYDGAREAADHDWRYSMTWSA